MADTDDAAMRAAKHLSSVGYRLLVPSARGFLVSTVNDMAAIIREAYAAQREAVPCFSPAPSIDGKGQAEPASDPGSLAQPHSAPPTRPRDKCDKWDFSHPPLAQPHPAPKIDKWEHEKARCVVGDLPGQFKAAGPLLWLWKNFVDGRPEYWAFDNPFPCHPSGDPKTLGQPCGYALVLRSTNGRPDRDKGTEMEELIQRETIKERMSRHIGAELRTVLARESATQQRHDEKMAEKDGEIARLRKALTKIAAEPVFADPDSRHDRQFYLDWERVVITAREALARKGGSDG